MRELIIAAVGALVLIGLGLASLNAADHERDASRAAAMGAGALTDAREMSAGMALRLAD